MEVKSVIFSNYCIHFFKICHQNTKPSLSLLYDYVTCPQQFNNIYVITSVELGRFHGRVTSCGVVQQRAIVQCVCILLAWNSTDGAGKSCITLFQHESKHIFDTCFVYIKQHSVIPGRKCERRSLGVRLGGNSCLISALSGLRHCHS
jgi:hypothetical protein